MKLKSLGFQHKHPRNKAQTFKVTVPNNSHAIRNLTLFPRFAMVLISVFIPDYGTKP